MDLYHFIRKIDWVYSREHGYGNGYVCIPSNHPLYGIKWNDKKTLSLNVHGGITFSKSANRIDFIPKDIKEKIEGKNYWVLGFDTVHFGDNQEKWTEKAVKKETLYLKYQLELMTI